MFQFKGELYEQMDGVATGSVVPLLANVFMCHIEDQLERKSMIPSFYRRYVDDTLVTMPNTESATDFLQVLNNMHPSLSPRGEVLPIMAYTGRLRPKGVPFSGFRYIKG